MISNFGLLFVSALRRCLINKNILLLLLLLLLAVIASKIVISPKISMTQRASFPLV